MEEKYFEVEAESILDARKQVMNKIIQEGIFFTSEETIAKPIENSLSCFGETLESAKEIAIRMLPPDVFITKQEVLIPAKSTKIQIKAPDAEAAERLAVKPYQKKGIEASTCMLTMLSEGAKSFWRIGRQKHIYQMFVNQHPKVLFTYSTKIKIRANISNTPQRIENIEWMLDYMPIASWSINDDFTKKHSRVSICERQEVLAKIPSDQRYAIHYESGDITGELVLYGGGYTQTWTIMRISPTGWKIAETGRLFDN
jgi:hypothetical protein